MKQKNTFWIYSIAGYLFLSILLILVFRYSFLGKILIFSRVFIVLSILYFLLLFLSSRIEKKLSNKSKIVLFVSGLAALAAALIILVKVLDYNFSENDYSSCSMYHAEKDFDKWWELNGWKYGNITKEEFEKFPFHNGMIGMAFFFEVKAENVRIGDVVSYYSPDVDRIIAHRVIEKWEEKGTYFKTLGDNNIMYEIVKGENVKKRFYESRILGFFERKRCFEK